MTDRKDSPRDATLQELEAVLEAHLRAAGRLPPRPDAAASDAAPLPAAAMPAAPLPSADSARPSGSSVSLADPHPPSEATIALMADAGRSAADADITTPASFAPVSETGAPPPEAEPTASPSRRPWLRRGLAAVRVSLVRGLRRPLVRRAAIAAGVTGCLAAVGCAALWWRLSSGPISLDLATPWLISAIEENLGSRYRIQVGGTQLERDAQGHTAVRLRDVVVSDSDGKSVAVAPKAEVGIAGTSLLIARPRAARLRLVDATMLVRIESDGRIDVFAGGEKPFASIAPDDAAKSSVPATGFSLQTLSERSLGAHFAAFLAWIDGLGERRKDGEGPTGFDGHALTEVGIINGGLTIEDRRSDRTWTLQQIGLRLMRPGSGGVAFTVGSDREKNPWSFHSSLTPGRAGHRNLRVEARKVAVDDLMALRLSADQLETNTQISASIHADIGTDGIPQSLNGTVLAEGAPPPPAHDKGVAGRKPTIDAAEFSLDWDKARGTLRVPFKINTENTRTALRAEFAAPQAADGIWAFAIGGGWILVDPPTPDEEQLVLRRVVVRGGIDQDNHRISFDQADFGSRELGGGNNPQDVSIAASGRFDYGGENPRMMMGLAAHPMSVASFKRIWPVFVAPTVREWVVEHMISGAVERVDIAVDAPVASLRDDGPSIPPDGLFVDIVTSNTSLRPVAGLPPIRGADLTAKITGSTAHIALGKGTVDISPGRRLVVSGGLFEVPDSRLDAPLARVRLRAEGTVPAAAELLALERLRDFVKLPFDPASARGNVAAQIALEMPLRADLPRGSTKYDLAVDLSSFSAERVMMGHKVEAQSLRVTASNQGYQIRGDVRINGTTAQLDYRKATADAEAEMFLAATLDDAARNRLGIDFGTALGGGVPLKLAGRIGTDDVSRFNVEADLTPVRIDQLLPGWSKPAGRPARAAFMVTKDKSGTRFDDVLVDGSGVLARGSVEIDPKGDLRTADFPVFAASEGDKASLKAERMPDGTLRVTMRGDVYDGRSFVKSAMSGSSDSKTKPKLIDIELDIRVGAVVGHHGEVLRALELRMARRGGQVRTFNMSAKIGRDTPLIGDIRTRVSTNRPILYFETNDAGSLFRFTDVYPRMVGGRIWVVMDPPTQDRAPQEGLVNLRDFAIRGESALDRVVAQQGNDRNAIDFTLARAEFTKTPGRVNVREGLVRGPMIGATIEGNIDYARDQVNMRGTLVPLYGINNMFGQIPIVGLFLGGGRDEGLLGITYEVTGPPGNPRPVVNPLSAIAPGLLRKFFEFRDTGSEARSFADPSR